MDKPHKGFSLVELMFAMTITLGIGMAVIQFFQQNERIFGDQQLILEMQQNARLVVSQIADEIRIAGQGVPIFSSRYDHAGDEALAVVLNGSDSTRLNIRA